MLKWLSQIRKCCLQEQWTRKNDRAAQSCRLYVQLYTSAGNPILGRETHQTHSSSIAHVSQSVAIGMLMPFRKGHGHQ